MLDDGLVSVTLVTSLRPGPGEVADADRQARGPGGQGGVPVVGGGRGGESPGERARQVQSVVPERPGQQGTARLGAPQLGVPHLGVPRCPGHLLAYRGIAGRFSMHAHQPVPRSVSRWSDRGVIC